MRLGELDFITQHFPNAVLFISFSTFHIIHWVHMSVNGLEPVQPEIYLIIFTLQYLNVKTFSQFSLHG